MILSYFGRMLKIVLFGAPKKVETAVCCEKPSG